MNDLLRQLLITRHLGQTPSSAENLANVFGISRATLKRDIAMARHLGAKIVSQRKDASSIYKLENWGDCCRTVETWIVLEEKRDITQLGRTIL